MEWTADGLIIGVRRHGESSVILEAMVAGRGRHLGLVRGGRSRKLSAALQPGNTVQLVWRARIEDHLGTYAVELLDARAATLIADRLRLYTAQLLCEHLRLLPERDPHDRLLARSVAILEDDRTLQALGPALARYELELLDELGFGLDLGTCAATGTTRDLTHVSPRSGRAVSQEAAAPYLDRLFRLPRFLVSDAEIGPGDIAAAFALTGYFLDRHVWSARPVDPPPTRDLLIGMLCADA